MKQSVIIPTLNEEKLLPNLLNQLAKKNLKEVYDFEIIISDGGSKDKTLDIALSYADVVKVFNGSTGVQNIAAGRNLGASYASGEIFIFLNGDIVLPDAEEFFRKIDMLFTEEYLAMTCKVKVFPEEEILLDKLYHWCYNKYFKLLNSVGIGMGRGECQIIRKDIFEKVGGYNESLAAGEDFELFKRIRKLGKVLFSEDICIYESPRRFRKLGYAGVTLSWIKNGFSVFFKNKSISKEWEQVR